MAENPSELNENLCKKCNGQLIKFCPLCEGLNDKLIENQVSKTINQKLANESNIHQDHSDMPDNTHVVCPKKWFIEDKKGLPLAYCNETKEVTLNLLNHGGNPYTESANVNCELKSAVDPSHFTELIVTGPDSRPGEYKISFQVANKGKYLLDIKVEGMHIEGNPFAINVIDNFDQANIAVFIGGVDHPQGIAINSRGEIIVVEYKKHCVSIFDSSTGNRIRSFGTKGSERGQFDYPCGVALDKDDNIFVTDARNDRIQKFSPIGEVMAVVGTQGSNNLEFCIPVGIGINPCNRRIYITESDGNRVQILKPDLTCYKCFGAGGGSGDAQFNKPKDVAFDSAGNVYIADNEHSQIQVFTAEGDFLRRFGSRGEGDGQMEFSSAVSIDKNDIVYVTDLYNSRILVFTKEGEYLTSYSSRGTGIGELKDPRGISVDHQNGVIYVSDYLNDRILKVSAKN
jgi:DNA-binding beta-propeller fold protein YncE